MNKRESVADDEQAQPCKKLKLKALGDAADAQTLDADAAFLPPSSSLEVQVTQATQDATTQEIPSSERRIKRKTTDDAKPSQSGEPDAKRAKITSNAGETTRRARSPMRLHFKWKDYIPKPEKKIAASQRQWYAAPREVAELFAAYSETDSEDERKRNGLPSPSSSVRGDALQQPANALGAHYLISVPRPAPHPEGAAGHIAVDRREPMAGHASGSGSTQRYHPASPGQPSASRWSSASPPPSRQRLNKGKAPAARSGTEKRHTPQSPEKRMPPLEKRKKKMNNGQRHRTDRDSGPHARHLDGFLRSSRSSRRCGKCELWYLGDDGVATCSVNKR